jgi:hypothetical protein
MTRFWDILQWGIVGAIAVAAFANAPKIATGITAFGHDFFVPTVLTIASAGQYRPPS